jgi:hypothetical protein
MAVTKILSRDILYTAFTTTGTDTSYVIPVTDIGERFTQYIDKQILPVYFHTASGDNPTLSVA